MSDAAHEHQWENGPIMEQEEVSHSPCSTWDDHLWTWVIQVQTCRCGDTRKLVLGYKDRRRRGDDARIAQGKQPLGVPLKRSAVYDPPKMLR